MRSALPAIWLDIGLTLTLYNVVGTLVKKSICVWSIQVLLGWPPHAVALRAIQRLLENCLVGACHKRLISCWQNEDSILLAHNLHIGRGRCTWSCNVSMSTQTGVATRLISRDKVVLVSGARRNLRRMLMFNNHNRWINGFNPRSCLGFTCPSHTAPLA